MQFFFKIDDLGVSEIRYLLTLTFEEKNRVFLEFLLFKRRRRFIIRIGISILYKFSNIFQNR